MIRNILLIGNTNNELFRLANILSEHHYKVTQVLIQQGRLHDPKELFFMKKYKKSSVNFIDLRNFKEGDVICHDNKLIETLKAIDGKFHFGIYDNVGASFSTIFQIPYISMVTGSNLSYYANPKLIDFRTDPWEEGFSKSNSGKELINRYEYFLEVYREGLKQSEALISFPLGVVPAEDQMLKELGLSDKERFTFSYIERLKLRQGCLFKRRKAKIVFAARLDSSNHLQPGGSERDDKGVEFLLPAILEVKRLNLRVKFVVFSKGKLFEDFKNKIDQFDLKGYVSFEREGNYKGYLKVLNNNDIVIDSIGKSTFGRISLDSISLNKIIFANVNNDIFSKFFGNSHNNFFHNVSSSQSLVAKIQEHTHNRSRPNYGDFIEITNKNQIEKIIQFLNRF
jgi:hypothetical protein